jgi:phosphatidate cytidylyltransferase
MLTGLYLNQWSFFILMSIIHFGCWIEYQKMVSLIDPGYKAVNPFHSYGIMIAGWSMMFLFAGDLRIDVLRFPEIGSWMLIGATIMIVFGDFLYLRRFSAKNFAHSIFGLIYISLNLALMIDLARETVMHIHDTAFILGERILPAIIIFTLWINDTMAYLVGSLIGKTPLTAISPKKTWEGTVGGILLAIVIMGLLIIFVFKLGKHFAGVVWFIIPAIAAVAGTFGDLLESKLKRLAGVKDSGTLMPGHGGFLDRFDSMLVAIPFVWLFVHFFLK